MESKDQEFENKSFQISVTDSLYGIFADFSLVGKDVLLVEFFKIICICENEAKVQRKYSFDTKFPG